MAESNSNQSTNKPSDDVLDDIEIKIKNDVEELSNLKLNLLNKISSENDLTKKQKSKSLNKIYPYWVMIFKYGKRIQSFGIREETIKGVKLLVRTEKVDNETKVLFLQLFPESSFDVNVISQNKSQIAKELNKLKQIARKLEGEKYEGLIKNYNYDISDIKILILKKEIELESIKYGKSFEYTHDIREDNIPVLMYDYNNGGLILRKYVKEKSIVCQASENKVLEDRNTEKQINEHLRKKNDRNYAIIGTWILVVCLLLIGTYGVFRLLDYNSEREFGEITNKLSKSIETYDRGLKTISNNCGVTQKPLLDTISQLTITNQEILESCVNNNYVEGGKPTIK